MLDNPQEKCVSQQPHVAADDKNISGQNKEHDKMDDGEEQLVEEESSDKEGEGEEVEDKMDEGDNNEQGNNEEPMKSQPAPPMKKASRIRLGRQKYVPHMLHRFIRPFFSKNK